MLRSRAHAQITSLSLPKHLNGVQIQNFLVFYSSSDLTLECFDYIILKKEEWDNDRFLRYEPRAIGRRKFTIVTLSWDLPHASDFRYVADMSRQRSESILKSEDKEGCFVVRNSSTKGLYTLSLFTKLPHSQVRHKLLYISSFLYYVEHYIYALGRVL